MNRLEKLEQENAGLREYADSRDESIKVYQKELEEEREKVRELKGEMKAVEDFLKPNFSNDMRWCDEIIIAIENRDSEKVRELKEALSDIHIIAKDKNTISFWHIERIARDALGHPEPDKGNKTK